jgi:hypothetical protein
MSSHRRRERAASHIRHSVARGQGQPRGALLRPPGAVTPPSGPAPWRPTASPDTPMTHRGCTQNEPGNGWSPKKDQQQWPTGTPFEPTNFLGGVAAG